jgi:hypothetical protein
MKYPEIYKAILKSLTIAFNLFDTESDTKVKTIIITPRHIRLIMQEYELFHDHQINNFYLTMIIWRILNDMKFPHVNHEFTIDRNTFEGIMKLSKKE